MSDDVALVLEHAVEADVSLSFAWNFRTDVANWNDPPARFEIDGRFLDGTRAERSWPGRGHWSGGFVTSFLDVRS